MNFFPKIKKCPCCESINLITVNGMSFENKFKNLEKWNLKKKINCRKCKSKLGLFFHKIEKEKLFWIDLLECENYYYKELNILQEDKDKYKTNKKKYYETLGKIINVQNQLRADTIKLKVKFKIQARQINPYIS